MARHLIPGSDLVSFLNEENCLGLGTCAAMLVRHSSVWLCGTAGITILRGRRPSVLASTCFNDSEIRYNIPYFTLHYYTKCGSKCIFDIDQQKVTVHCAIIYPISWSQGGQISTDNPDTKTQCMMLYCLFGKKYK